MPQILIVDDNIESCHMLIRLFKRHGYHAECVESGSGALEYLAHSGPPCLVILDYMMPDMNGMDVLREVRADPKTAELPVVLYTASDDPRVAWKAKQLGANDVWVKASIDFEEMENRIKQLLN